MIQQCNFCDYSSDIDMYDCENCGSVFCAECAPLKEKETDPIAPLCEICTYELDEGEEYECCEGTWILKNGILTTI